MPGKFKQVSGADVYNDPHTNKMLVIMGVVIGVVVLACVIRCILQDKSKLGQLKGLKKQQEIETTVMSEESLT